MAEHHFDTPHPTRRRPSESGSDRWNHRCHGGPHPMVRWEALATGSLVGLGAWALAYVLGATLLLVCGLDAGALPPVGQLAVGGFGGLSASMALALAAFTAARTGGARSAENALFYGLCLWSMSTLTLVTLVTLSGQGFFSPEMLRAAPIFAVGLSAVGSLPEGQALASASTFGAVLAVLIISLACALWGGARAFTLHRSAHFKPTEGPRAPRQAPSEK